MTRQLGQVEFINVICASFARGVNTVRELLLIEDTKHVGWNYHLPKITNYLTQNIKVSIVLSQCSAPTTPRSLEITRPLTPHTPSVPKKFSLLLSSFPILIYANPPFLSSKQCAGIFSPCLAASFFNSALLALNWYTTRASSRDLE